MPVAVSAAPRPVRHPVVAPPSAIESGYAAILHDSEEAGNLLKRASQAVAQKDWKLAVDSLQRIIELPGDSVLQATSGAYESARRRAHRLIAALPPEGLEAYRLIHDAEARARLEQAVRDHDETALREIVDRHLLTRSGDDASLALAGWWLDQGQASSAAALLGDLRAIYPDSDTPAAEIDAELAMALALAGRTAAAEELLQKLAPRSATQPALAGRLKAIGEAIPQFRRAAAPVAEAWPLFLGSLSRSGLMPHVEPTLVERSLWQVPLRTEADAPLADVDDYRRRSHAFPAAQPVTDGRVLVVRQEGRLWAIDVETFEVLWQADSPGEALREEDRQRTAMMQRLNQFQRPGQADGAAAYERNTRIQRLLIDRLEGAVTLGHGLAMMVRRSSESLLSLSRLFARDQSVRWAVGEGVRVRDELVAYDLRTGRERWRRGLDERGPDALSDVEFLAPPVPVGDRLIVPYRSAGDLYVAVLDPADGRLVRRIYLCGLGTGEVNSFEPLHVCVSDGIAYIPTNRGVLFALDTLTWTILWASRYPQDLAEVRVNEFTQEIAEAVGGIGWREGAPMAAGGLVLLAPADTNRLVAFNRVDGSVLWTVDRGHRLYVLGADSQHAWLAGQTVVKISLEAGKAVWERDVGAPTGRGAVSGNRLYLPTTEDLAVLSAENGEIIDRLEPPPGQPPLGNILCFGGSLYSCDLRAVRRYPDIVRSYEAALAACTRDRSSPPSAIRLASLELLRDQPAQALVVLDAARLDDAPEATRYQDAVAHLRTEALLALARRPDTGEARANELLRAARTVARSPADAIRTGLALAEQLQRTGRGEDAYRQYADIALSKAGDTLIDGAAGVQQPARLLVAARLGKLEPELAEPQRAAVVGWLTGMLDTAVRARRDGGEGTVAWMVDSGLPADVSQRALLALSAWAQDDELLEAAECHLRRLVRRPAPPDVMAEALVRLVAIYLGPDELHMPLSAVPLLQMLGGECAAVRVPARLVDHARTDTMAGAQAAAMLGARLDRSVLARHEAAVENLRLGAPREPAYVHSHPDALPLLFRQGRPEPLADVMLLLSDTMEVRAHLVRDGQMLWPAMLRLVEDPVEVTQSAQPARLIVRMGPQAFVASGQGVPSARAVYDGQTMVVNTDRGLHAVGLATGLRLWSRRYVPPVGLPPASDTTLWADDGNLLSLDGRGLMMMLRLADGSVRWQRSAASDRWRTVRVRGEHVVAVDETITNASVFRSDDGRMLGRIAFPENARRALSLTVFDEVLCGPAGEGWIAAFELATPGIERWRMRVERDGKPLTVAGLFKPLPNVLGIGCAGGIVRLVEAATGRVMADIATGVADAEVFEGAITDGVLCLYATRAGQDGAFLVLAVDARDGRLLWSRVPRAGEFWSQAGTDYPADNSLLRAANNAIPVARLKVRSNRNPMVPNTGDKPDEPQTLELTVLNKRTGEPVGQPASVKLANTEPMMLIEHVLAWPDRVIVVGGSTYVAFAADKP